MATHFFILLFAKMILALMFFSWIEWSMRWSNTSICDHFVQQIPRWWIWLYYIVPTSWSLNGILTSQFGDIEEKITVFGERKTVAAFLRDYFGYQHHLLPLVAVMLILYPIVFAALFGLCISKLNFQRR